MKKANTSSVTDLIKKIHNQPAKQALSGFAGFFIDLKQVSAVIQRIVQSEPAPGRLLNKTECAVKKFIDIQLTEKINLFRNIIRNFKAERLIF